MTASMRVEGCWAIFGDPSVDKILCCFSPAGANPTASFKNWRRHLPSDVCILGYCRPGRSFREDVRLVVDFDQIVNEVINGLLEFFAEHPASAKTRLLFFGHSMGTLEAFAVASALEENSCYREIVPLPVALVVAGHSSPAEESDGVPSSAASDALMYGRLEALGGFRQASWTPELIQLFVPIFRADMQVHERYYEKPRHVRSRSLDTPIFYFGGESDSVAPRAAQEAWAHQSKTVRIKWYPGGHFFFAEQSNEQIFLADLLSCFALSHEED